MINTETAVRLLQAVAMTVGIALLLWSTGLPTFFRIAEAASITNASDTLSNSAPSTVSNHTITFTTPNGILPSAKFRVTFAGTFTMGSVAESDIDILVAGTASTTQAGQTSGATTWGVDIVGSSIDFTAPSGQTVASSTEISILIGTNSTLGGVGVNRITNPSATTTSHAIDIGVGTSTIQDSGQVRVAIIDDVTVSASVETSLTFTVAGVNASSTVNTSPTTTVATTTPTTLPFGTLPIGVSRTLAQDLAVSTNATNGFVVTVQQTGNLQSSTGADIDGFIDGAYTDAPTSWTSPGGLIANENTYGHWGLTSNDGTTTRPSGEFGEDEWVAASTTPTIVMGHTGPADGATEGSGATRVGYQVQITALQEAGDDYNTTLRYVATPTF